MEWRSALWPVANRYVRTNKTRTAGYQNIHCPRIVAVRNTAFSKPCMDAGNSIQGWSGLRKIIRSMVFSTQYHLYQTGISSQRIWFIVQGRGVSFFSF